jgi:putative endonuclease
MPNVSRTGCFWIYILECDDGSYYTGYTSNMARRYRQHVDGSAGVRYTRSHQPVRIAQCWRLFDTVGTALKVESLIKKRPRRAKQALVAHPEALGPLASRAVSRELRIFTADPEAVEVESLAMTREDVRNGRDPFAGLPPADL